MSRKVLVVEDDRDLARLIRLHLSDIGCEVECIHNGRSGLDRALAQSFDLIVLDVMLPDLDGFEICRELRKQSIHTPVLMLTARSEVLDKVLGLELGADDYMTKPFSVRELVARVKAMFRRLELTSEDEANSVNGEPIETRGLKIELDKRLVSVEDRPVELTPREFDLLVHFAQQPGRVFTRTQLLEQVWGYQHGGYEHTVNSHINRLRSKIEADPSKPELILTVWGVGYKFAESDA